VDSLNEHPSLLGFQVGSEMTKQKLSEGSSLSSQGTGQLRHFGLDHVGWLPVQMLFLSRRRKWGLIKPVRMQTEVETDYEISSSRNQYLSGQIDDIAGRLAIYMNHLVQYHIL
jgi:hypothetical protein